MDKDTDDEPIDSYSRRIGRNRRRIAHLQEMMAEAEVEIYSLKEENADLEERIEQDGGTVLEMDRLHDCGRLWYLGKCPLCSGNIKSDALGRKRCPTCRKLLWAKDSRHTLRMTYR